MPLDIASGETKTVASGRTLYANEVNLTGEINLTGELTTADASVSASGSGDSLGTATATPQYQASASGVGEGIASRSDFPVWYIPSGTTETVASGDTTTASQINLSGELNLTGEVQAGSFDGEATGLREASASGSGDGVGTATATRIKSVSASGIGEGVAFQTEFDRLNIASGTTRNVASGDVLDAGEVELEGELNLTGELQVEDAKPIALYGEFRSASGVGEGVGSAVKLISIPLIRGDSQDVDWHEDDDIDLGADSDGAI